MSISPKDENELMKEIGMRFKQFRKSLNLTQKDLAKAILTNSDTISNIETGKIIPSLPLLNSLFQRYGLNLNWIICGGNEEMLLKKH